MASKLEMRFWGIEVKSGESVVIEPGTTLVHISQACLDEVKKGNNNDSISLFVKIDDQKLVLGHLYADKIPQLYFDLVFDKKFMLSHDGKSGSVHIQGYIADVESGIEPKVRIVEAKNENVSNVKDSSSDGDDKNDDESEDEESDQVKSVEDSSDDDESDTEDDDSEDEPEETPNKVGKKRAAETSKTPVQKKAKFVTPEKTDGKKGAVHIATPYPSKQAVKKSATSDQTKPQSSNTSGSGAYRCTPCNRTFNSDGALQSHTKAKHGAAK